MASAAGGGTGLMFVPVGATGGLTPRGEQKDVNGTELVARGSADLSGQQQQQHQGLLGKRPSLDGATSLRSQAQSQWRRPRRDG